MKSSIRWIEGIYQKIESVCDDVDNTISQAVGKNVKKFCSDVIQDLITPEFVLRKDEPPKESCGDNDNKEGVVHGEANTLLQETVRSVQSSAGTKTQESDIKGAGTLCRSTEIEKNAVTTPGALSQSNDSSPWFSVTDEKSNAVESFFHECAAPRYEYDLAKSLCDSSDGTSTLDSLTLQIDTGYYDATQESQGDHDNKEEHEEAHTLQQETASSIQLSAWTETQEPDTKGAGKFCRSAVIEKNDVTSSDTLSQSNASLPPTFIVLKKPQDAEKNFHECTTPGNDDELAKSPCDGLDGSSALETSESGIISFADLLVDSQPNCISDGPCTYLDALSQSNASSPPPSIAAGKPHAGESIEYICPSLDYELAQPPCENSDGSSASESTEGGFTSYPDHLMDALPTFMSEESCTNSGSSASDSLKDSIKFPPADMLVNIHAHHCSPHRARSLKSYKKLLQDTVSSKRRTVKNYRQLGIWHGDIFEEHDSSETIQSPSCEPVTSSPQDMSIQGQSLTEWEIL